MFKDLKLEREYEGSKGEIVSIQTGKEIIKHLNENYGITDNSKHLKFILSEYYKDAIESAIKGELIDTKREILINDEDGSGDLIISIDSLIYSKGEKIKITVNLSEENDLISVINSQTEEVIYEW